MLNSKALKERKPRWLAMDCGCPMGVDTDCNLFQKGLHHVLQFIMFKVVYPIESFFDVKIDRTRRAWDYARFGWKNYDFDFACAYDLLNFKLKRIRKALENGHAVQEDEDMKALSDLIKITWRLQRGRYEDKYYRQHERRWGKLETKTIPEKFDKNGEPTLFKWESWRSGTLNATEEVKNQEMEERQEMYKKADQDYLNDVDKLAHILKAHARKWWD